MPQSQVTPQETQPQDSSQTQAAPPVHAGQPKHEQSTSVNQQRAQQERKRQQTEKKNPFAAENRDARRQKFLDTLRSERGIAPPSRPEVSNDEAAKDSGNSHVPRGIAEPHSEPRDGVSSQAQDVKVTETKPDEPPEWYKREQQLRASEERAAKASADAEQQRAALEKARADADEAVAKMAAAKDDPIEFLAQQGMTQEEWSEFLQRGGKLTPEQRKLKEMNDTLSKMQARVDAAEKREQEQAAAARYAAEESQFSSRLHDFTFVPQMGGIAAVRQQQALLTKQTGQAVSLSDAADNLEQLMGQNLQRILQNPKIRSSLKLDVNTSPAGQAAEPPRTLSNRVSSHSNTQADAKPHPLDFAAKRNLWKQRMEQERQAKIGR